MGPSTTRREFLGTTAVAAASAWAGAGLFAAGASASPGPNETINLGIIGCGQRSKELLPCFMNAPGSRVVAVCDVDSRHLEDVRQLAGGEKVRAYRDYRKLLADKDVNAVIISTNVHWHVLCTIGACQAGKDVYVEKPLCHFSAEGLFAVEAARKYDRIVQIGTNQHSCEHYRKAVEIIRSGRLGNIMEVKVWDTEHYGSLGRPADCDPPKELDWDFYVGPSPMRPYNPRYHAFDWFKDFGGGFQVAWGVHHYDIVHWAMGVQWPKTVMANGGNYAGFHDCREWPDTFSAIVEYGPGPVAKDGFLLQYTARPANRYLRRSHSKSFHGTNGTLWVDRSRYTIVGETQSGRLVDKEGAALEVGKKVIPDEEVRHSNDIYRHVQVFLDNVRNHKKPKADVEVGYHATNVGHLMNVAYEAGRKIHWDGQRNLVVGDAEANALLNRRYRAPWKLEV
jgi:predicted dehydrogenase